MHYKTVILISVTMMVIVMVLVFDLPAGEGESGLVAGMVARTPGDAAEAAAAR